MARNVKTKYDILILKVQKVLTHQGLFHFMMAGCSVCCEGGLTPVAYYHNLTDLSLTPRLSLFTSYQTPCKEITLIFLFHFILSKYIVLPHVKALSPLTSQTHHTLPQGTSPSTSQFKGSENLVLQQIISSIINNCLPQPTDYYLVLPSLHLTNLLRYHIHRPSTLP